MRFLQTLGVLSIAGLLAIIMYVDLSASCLFTTISTLSLSLSNVSVDIVVGIPLVSSKDVLSREGKLGQSATSRAGLQGTA